MARRKGFFRKLLNVVILTFAAIGAYYVYQEYKSEIHDTLDKAENSAKVVQREWKK